MRRGQLCLGAALLAVSGCQSPAADSIQVDGRVSLGPLCPVEREDAPCPTPPGAFDDGEAVATNGTAESRAPLRADGSFRLVLPAGEWQVTSTIGMSCTPVAVTASAVIVVDCDTGIR